jgi:hypothetical protein
VYILVGDGQVELYSKREFLEGAVEAVDASLFRVFDGDGREYTLSGEYSKRKFLGLHWVDSRKTTLGPSTTSNPEVLRVALLDWWLRTGGEQTAASWNLLELLQAVATRDGVR